MRPNHNDLSGLSPLWLILLATVLGILLSLAMPFIYGNEPVKPSDWIGFAGSVLTAGVAVAAIYYAGRNITRQLRINLISREEDRIEADLPGLRDTVDKLVTMLSQFRGATNAHTMGQLLRAEQFAGTNISAEVDKVFWRSNAQTRRRLTEVFFDFIRAALSAGICQTENTKAQTDLANISGFHLSQHKKVRDEAARAKTDYDEKYKTMMEKLDPIREYQEELERLISEMEGHLPKFRSEISSFLDD
jgi:hypothetical protein